MTSKPFDFWQDHSVKYLEMALKSDRLEPLQEPDGVGRHTGECGDTVVLFLKLRGAAIAQVGIQIQGCMNTVASANAVAELIEGRSIDDAWNVTPEKVIGFLETLPKAHYHCAELAVGALYRALADTRSKQRDPWKKIYSKSG
ncbi:MAG: iron-sulfur cluster assembly scaffold protein [Desulfobacterales bacterium]